MPQGTTLYKYFFPHSCCYWYIFINNVLKYCFDKFPCFLSIHGHHDVKPIDGIQCFTHGVKVSSIYIVSRGLVWFEGRIAQQMKMGAYMITISQAWEIINVINHYLHL